MICDAHVHFFSPGFFAGLNASRDAVTALGFEFPASVEALADRWVAELDANGVARSALMASLPGDADSVAEAVARHHSRFAGFFMLDPTRDDAIEYATRSLDAGLQTICLFPAMHRYPLHDDCVARVFELADCYAARRAATTSAAGASPTSKASPTREASPTPTDSSAEALRAKVEGRRPVVFAHCGVLSVGVRKKLGLASPFDLRFGNPLDLHGVALRFPAVPIVIPHFGAGLLREALMVASLCPNVLLDTSSSNSWIKQTPGLTLAQVFRTALDVVGPERLLFGSDSSFFPRGWVRRVLDDQRAAMTAAGATGDQMALVTGGNLARLFPIDGPRRLPAHS